MNSPKYLVFQLTKLCTFLILSYLDTNLNQRIPEMFTRKEPKRIFKVSYTGVLYPWVPQKPLQATGRGQKGNALSVQPCFGIEPSAVI